MDIPSKPSFYTTACQVRQRDRHGDFDNLRFGRFVIGKKDKTTKH